MTLSVGLSHSSQSSLIDRLVVVDISPAQTSTFTDFRSYIQAMQEVKISSDIPRSTARRMAEDQLRSLVQVSAPRWTVAAFFCEIKPAIVLRFNLRFSRSSIFGPFFWLPPSESFSASVPAHQPGGAERPLRLEGQSGGHLGSP